MYPHLPDAIIGDIAQEYGVSVERMKSRRRFAELVEARAIAMKALYVEGLTMDKIGEILNRHHSTVSIHIRRAW